MRTLREGKKTEHVRTQDATPAPARPLATLPVEEDEIAAVEAFLGLHFAMIFDDAQDQQKPRVSGASGGQK